ncbi:tropomyosin alpha-3 chain-like [Bolinopsis microptera]|uniref:tropomyosin alpha-3 chain-like n=1 Tax=Bolinopsis microptera TaxID=2820187 RepID=UPI00307A1B0A
MCQINQELLQELEEENKALRSELRSTIASTQQLLSLENEIRRLKSESSRYQAEVLRLKDVDLKLNQVEQFYHEEKKNFRCTIEDTLLTLEDFRKDKENLERELLELEELLKDAEQKKGSLREELVENNTLLKNNVEKLKLEIETRQSENSMLQTRISTVEENCSFLEGQVQALDRDNHEKAQIITAAEQHAKDMERELATLRKENAALHSEQHKIEPLEHELEELKSNLASLKEEKPALQCKVDKAEEENSQLHSRLSELVKSHTLLEESVQNKDRVVISMQQELDSLKKISALDATHAKEKEGEAMKECEDLKQKNCQLSEKLEKLKSEMEYIEQAFFRGWSDHIDEYSSEESKSVTFQDQSKSPSSQAFPKAERIIQSIKLDRQKLKAKLVRSVQDSKTLHAQLRDTQEALERESAGLAKRVREALTKLEESEVKSHVLERTAKNLSIQVEELNVVNKSLELENYHLKKLNET